MLQDEEDADSGTMVQKRSEDSGTMKPSDSGNKFFCFCYAGIVQLLFRWSSTDVLRTNEAPSVQGGIPKAFSVAASDGT